MQRMYVTKANRCKSHEIHANLYKSLQIIANLWKFKESNKALQIRANMQIHSNPLKLNKFMQ